MPGHRRHDDRSDLTPALGIVIGSAVMLVLTLAVSGTGAHLAYGITGGAAGGLLVALGVQLWRRS